MDREKIDGWLEKGILGLVLGILIFGPLALGGKGMWEFLVLQGMTAGVMTLWAARLWIGESPKILWPPICWAVIAFMAYAIVRYFQADIEYVARAEMIRVLLYGFLFCAIVNNCHRQETTQKIVLTLLFLGMAIACYACTQYLSKTQYVYKILSSYPGRGSGTFIYPNHLAGFLEMLFPLGLCCVLIGRYGHVTKVVLGYASVVMMAGIGVTLSRGGWLVSAAELMVLCGILLVQRDYRVQGAVLMAVLLVAVALTVPRMQAMRVRVQATVKSGRADDLRFAVWQPAVEIWREHFWWGAGPAHFDYRFPEHRPTSVQLRPEYVHNDYLNTLADWGVAGAILVASAWVLLYWGVVKTWRAVRGGRDDFSRKKSSKFALLVGAAIGLLGILLHSFLDFNMHMPSNAILAVTLMALLSSQWRFQTERFWFRANMVLKLVGSLLLLAGVVYFIRMDNRTAHEYYWLRQAKLIGQPPHNYSYAKIAALEKAAAVEPMNFDTTYAIAECYRLKSWDGGDDYVALAKKAMDWYAVGMKLNPYDSYNWLGTGMCLDWIALSSESAGKDSTPYYEHANALDPNNYFITAHIGWHYAQTDDWAAARVWFERSRRLEWNEADNQIALEYLPIVDKRLQEEADKIHRLKP